MNNVLLPVVAVDDLVLDVGVDVMAGFHTPTPSFSGQIDNALTLIRKGEKEKLDTTGRRAHVTRAREIAIRNSLNTHHEHMDSV